MSDVKALRQLPLHPVFREKTCTAITLASYQALGSRPFLRRARLSTHPGVTTDLPLGLRAGGAAAGIKKGRLDLGLLVADGPLAAAAVFTRNLVRGAHVRVIAGHLAATRGRARAVLVNAGNANCSTGEEGVRDNRRVCAALAEQVGCRPEEVLFLSTGVIGARLPVEKVLAALPAAALPIGIWFEKP